MTKPFTSGAGGGSGPKNSRDSLFSGDAVEVVLGISEGPIEGIKGATIEEKLKNVYLDGTPILTASGDKSFKESQVVINFEPGTAVTEVEDPVYGQTPIPYMLGGTATPVAVSASLEQDVSITRTVPSLYRNKYNKIEIRLMVARLANVTKDGAKELSVRVRIDHKKSADASWNTETHTISGKTLSGGFVRSFAFFLPDTSVDRDLRVTMLDVNDPETTIRELFWLNYELSESLNKDGQVTKEYHPGTAMMTFVSKIGENFNRIPGLTAVWRGLLCKVPSNYDPVARTYNESTPWDGTFKTSRVWTNNPFWIVRELITNPRFGMARYNPRVTVDDFSLYEEAKYADTMRTVDGKTIPLFTFNGVIRDPMLGLELINFILGSAHAQAIEYASGFLKIVSDRNVAAIMDVTPEMCVQQDSGIVFNYSSSALKDRPNEVQATYIEPELDWQEQFVGPFRDEEAQKSQGVNIYEFKALGCTNIYEATYKAFYRLISAQTEVLTCTFTIPLMAISWEIYDIINIVDPDMDWGMSGRARSITGTTVILRDPLYFEAIGTYSFLLQTANGSTVTHSFNIPAVGSYSTLTLTAAVTASLAEYPAFSIQKTGAAPGVSKPFRIVAISRVDGASHLRSITCVEVNRNKWQQALDGVLGEKPRYNFEQPRMPKGPNNLSYIGETSLIVNGELSPMVRLQWDTEQYSFLGLAYAVYVSENGNPFYEAAVTRTSYYEFPIKRDIVYQFYVQLRYQDIKLNSNILDWQSYRLRPADIVESNLAISVTQEFNYLSMKLKLAATYLIPGTDQTLDLFGSNEISGFNFELIGTVVPPTGPSYPTTILQGTQTSPEILLEGSTILTALNTANGGWSLHVRLISRDSEALLNELPFKWNSTPTGSGGYLWRKSRQYTAGGVALGEWGGLQNLTLGQEIQFSANGSTWVYGYLSTHKFYRTRTVTNNGSGNVYGAWSASVNFVDYSTSATHPRYIFVYSTVTPPNYNEFPWQKRQINVTKPEFPTVQGITLISSSRTISGELSSSGGTVPAEVEWWVADSDKVPDTQQPPDGQGNYPLKVVMNPRKLAHTGASMYGLYVGVPEMDCQVWVRFKYAGYYSSFWPADVFNSTTGQMEPAPGQIIKTQKASFDELGLNLEKTVFVYQRATSKPLRPTKVSGTYLAPVPAGWSLAVPPGSDTLWMTSRIFYLDGTSTEWNEVTSAAQTLTVQYSPDGINDWSSAFRETDMFMRQSTDGGVTWSTAIRIVGEDGQGGKYIDFRFQRAATQPAQPTNVDSPAGWLDYPPGGAGALWMIRGTKNALGQLQGTWSNVIKLSGEDGNYIEFRYQRSATQPATPTGATPAGWTTSTPAGTTALWMVQATKNAAGAIVVTWSTPVKITGDNAPVTLVQYSVDGAAWHSGFQAFDVFMRQSTDNGVTWSAAIRIVGEKGKDGPYVDYIFIRSATPPTTPTGQAPAGWFDAPPTGTDPLYMSSAKKNADGTLIGSWSAPVQLTGDKGAEGRRGTVHVYVLTSSAVWSDAAANSALTGAPHNGKIVADRVTQSYPAGKWSETRTWTGSAWSTVAEVIDGSLLVTGSITADKININSLFATEATITGSLMVGNATNYLRLGGNYYIEAMSSNSQLFAVGNGVGFVDGEYLRGSSVKQKHLDASVVSWLRSELGAGNPEFGGLRTYSGAFSSNTFPLPSLNSNATSISFNYNYGGRGIMKAYPSAPSTPLIEVTIKRGTTTVATQTFSGSATLDEPGLYALQLPMIDWSPSEATPPAGPLTYSVQIMVYNWPEAYQGTHNFRAYQVPSGAAGTTSDWANITNKPLMTDPEVVAGTSTVAKIATAAQLKLAVNSFNAATATRLKNNITINGVAFTGESSITIATGGGGTLTPGSYLTGSAFTGSNSVTWSVNAVTTATASTVAARDASGNLTANVFNGSLNGNATSATTATSATSATTATSAVKLATARSVSMSGDVVWNPGTFDGQAALSGTASLSTTGVVANTYGSSTQVPVLQIDSKGRVTSATNATLTVTSLSSGGTSWTPNYYGWTANSAAGSSVYVYLGSHGAAMATGSEIGFLNNQLNWAFRVTQAGNASCAGTLTATDCISTSDARVKTGLAPIENALELIEHLAGLTFNRIDQNNRRCAGLIAQDVKKVLPEGVYESEGKLHVSNLAVTGLIVEALKALKREVRAISGGPRWPQ
jgi:hypothetical protein